jgi:hypothetical protein
MENNTLLQTWKKYMNHKLSSQSSRRIDLIDKLKLYNNNQQHIHSQITKQAEYIINKLIHAFSTSMVSIYDTKIFDVLLELFPEIDPELKKYITNFIEQSPWLYTIQQGFLKTLGMIKEYILYSHGLDNHNEKPELLLDATINETIYNILNCWVISCFTVVFGKALFSLDTIELNLPYLFFVAGSYSIVDFIIDENTEHPQIIKDILRQFETGLLGDNPPQQTESGLSGGTHQADTTSTIKESFLRGIKYLMNTYKNGSNPDKSKLQMIIYSMATEKECFKLQRIQGLSSEKIIELAIHKGLSTGYLILASLNESSYQSCIAHNNMSLFNHYCILIQLLDDLSDYIKDKESGINTCATLFKDDLNGYAWFVIDCVLDFLENINSLGIFNTQLAKGFNLMFINYWCYCCNKNMAFLDNDLINVIKDNYIFDMNYVIEMRAEKHKKKYELYKLLLSSK